MKKVYIILIAIIAGAAIWGLPSCTKYADPPPYFEEIDTLKTLVGRKVLIIGVDGFASAAVQKIAPAKLASILQKSKYSWDAVSDVPSNSATVWKTLTSGVGSEKHMVLDSTFMKQVPDDVEGQFQKAYPSIFNLMLSSAKPDYRSCLIANWASLGVSAVPETETKVLTNSDLATKDSLVNRLKATKAHDVYMVEFSDLLRTGIQYGFSEMSSQYRDAVNKLADYLTEIINTLKARPEYDKTEEWMVIITGTNGGVNNSYNGGTVPEREVPLIYYNERFKPVEFSAQGLYSSVEIGVGSSKDVSTKATVANATEFDFGTTGEYTVQFKYYSTVKSQYPVFFSKIQGGLNNNGWAIFTNNSGIWCLQLGNGSTTRYQTSDAGDVHNGQWHTLTFVVYDSASKRWAKRFTDGRRINEGSTTRDLAGKTLSSPAPFTVGYGGDPSQGAIRARFADITFFNAALDDATIVANLCNTDILNTHPKKGNIYAYWPCNDGMKNVFNNWVNPARPLTLSNSFTWTSAIAPCSIANATPKANAIQTRFQIPDISRQVFYWLGIDVQKNWGLDGVLWLDKYETEFFR